TGVESPRRNCIPVALWESFGRLHSKVDRSVAELPFDISPPTAQHTRGIYRAGMESIDRNRSNRRHPRHKRRRCCDIGPPEARLVVRIVTPTVELLRSDPAGVVLARRYRYPVILITDDTRLASLIALVRTLTQFASRIASPTPQAAIHPNGASMALASRYRRPSHRRRHRHRDPRVDAGARPRIRLRQLTFRV